MRSFRLYSLSSVSIAKSSSIYLVYLYSTIRCKEKNPIATPKTLETEIERRWREGAIFPWSLRSFQLLFTFSLLSTGLKEVYCFALFCGAENSVPGSVFLQLWASHSHNFFYAHECFIYIYTVTRFLFFFFCMVYFGSLSINYGWKNYITKQFIFHLLNKIQLARLVIRLILKQVAVKRSWFLPWNSVASKCPFFLLRIIYSCFNLHELQLINY